MPTKNCPYFKPKEDCKRLIKFLKKKRQTNKWKKGLIIISFEVAWPLRPYPPPHRALSGNIYFANFY